MSAPPPEYKAPTYLVTGQNAMAFRSTEAAARYLESYTPDRLETLVVTKSKPKADPMQDPDVTRVVLTAADCYRIRKVLADA